VACRLLFGAKFCLTLITCLLVCGIVTIEVPELICLTDNTANDFATPKIDSSAPLVQRTAETLHVAASQFEKTATPIVPRLSPVTIEIAQLISSGFLALHSILRT